MAARDWLRVPLIQLAFFKLLTRWNRARAAYYKRKLERLRYCKNCGGDLLEGCNEAH